MCNAYLWKHWLLICPPPPCDQACFHVRSPGYAIRLHLSLCLLHYKFSYCFSKHTYPHLESSIFWMTGHRMRNCDGWKGGFEISISGEWSYSVGLLHPCCKSVCVFWPNQTGQQTVSAGPGKIVATPHITQCVTAVLKRTTVQNHYVKTAAKCVEVTASPCVSSSCMYTSSVSFYNILLLVGKSTFSWCLTQLHFLYPVPFRQHM